MIVVVNYEMGNLLSVSKALEKVGARVKVSSDRQEVEKAEALVLPGVGAFPQAMENLRSLRLIPVIQDSLRMNKPFLGICLGLQLLFSRSEEGGNSQGLDIIPGEVKRFSVKTPLKIPHMGWNTVKRTRGAKCSIPIWKGIPGESYFYFVHSYYVQPEEEGVIVGTTEYDLVFTSMIQRGNIIACQFHPEKSGEMGLKLLRNFVLLAGGKE